jgi:hypothetical protein
VLSSGDFSEAALKDIEGGFPEDEAPYVEDYGYLSDSDLDEEEEDQTFTVSSVEAVASKSAVDAEPTRDAVRLGRVIIIRDAALLT